MVVNGVGMWCGRTVILVRTTAFRERLAHLLTIPSEDLPMLLRFEYANNVSAFDLNSLMPSHVDIPRLRQGLVGGFFWSAFSALFTVSCT
jgi:hypothetical protein